MQLWDIISQGGILYSMVGNAIPRWEMVAFPPCPPSLKAHLQGRLAGGRPPFVEAAEGRLPYGWVSRLGRQGINPTIYYRGIPFPTLE